MICPFPTFSPLPDEEVRRVTLAAGTLHLLLHHEDVPLDTLCDFGVRQNPRRAFLFVSRVLGRHLAAPPHALRDVAERLAAKLPATLPGPILVVALAEMAVALGQFVHLAYTARTGRTDLVSLHSSRHVVGPHLEFTERHSHAARHFLHHPHRPLEQQLLRTARTVLVVDDEITTGATLLDLVRTLREQNPTLEHVALASPLCLADPATLEGAVDLPLTLATLVRASLHVEPDPSWRSEPTPNVDTVERPARPRWALRSARTGRHNPDEVLPALDAMAARLRLAAGERVLVVGTGEFCYEPHRLAEILVTRGVDAHVQATSRSPAALGHAMRSRLAFPDTAGEGRVNFLYNVEPAAWDRIVVFYEERPPHHPLPDQLRHVGGRVEVLSWN